MIEFKILNMTTGERIRQRMTDLSIKAKDIAENTGASKGTVSNWVNDVTEPSGDYLVKLARYLGVSEEWIISGKSETNYVNEKSFAYSVDNTYRSNVIRSIDPRSYVPIISWVQAGSWKESDLEEINENTEYIPCHVAHSRNTFALRVQGDSMQSTSGKSYPDGMVIIVDADQKNPEIGRRVIALLKDSNDITFKQLASDGTRAYLKPLNNSFPPMFEAFEIVGTVIGAYQPE